MKNSNTVTPTAPKEQYDKRMEELERCVGLALSIRQLERADIPEYQRETIPSTVSRMTKAMLNNEIFPPIMLLYKPDKNGGIPYEEVLNYDGDQLDDIRFTVIDGKHRRLAALEANLPLGGYCTPSIMVNKEETQSFIRLQYGRHVNTNHLIAIDDSKPENRWVVKLATDPDSPLMGKIYLGRGKKEADQINAVNFTQLVSRKMIEPDELWDFSVFYRKVFFGNKIYSGGFKGCALLWKYLQKTKFDITNPEHIAVLKRFDWTKEENLYASKLNSNEDSRQFGNRLIKVWTDYEEEKRCSQGEHGA